MTIAVECRAESHPRVVVYRFDRLSDGEWAPIVGGRASRRLGTVLVDGQPPGAGPDRIRMHCRRCGLNVTLRTDSRAWARLRELFDRFTGEGVATVTLRGVAAMLS